MKSSNTTNYEELVALSELINRRKIADITRYNIERIEQALRSSREPKAEKINFCVGKNAMYASEDQEGIVISNIDRIFEVTEKFYREL